MKNMQSGRCKTHMMGHLFHGGPWTAISFMHSPESSRDLTEYLLPFAQGRRSADDDRQIGRWSRCAGNMGRYAGTLSAVQT